MTHHPTDLLPLYLAGEVDETERLQIAAHLAACTACSRMLERVRATSSRLEQLQVDPSPPDLTRRIVDASRRRRPLAVSPLWLASLAAAVVVGIALGSMWSAVLSTPRTPSSATTGQQFMLMMLEPVAERLTSAADAGRAGAGPARGARVSL